MKPEVIELLREEASKNMELMEVCKILAARRRSRGYISVTGLKQAIKDSVRHKTTPDTFKCPMNRYQWILEVFATLGFGKLTYSKRGKVKALTQLTVSPREIGSIVLVKKEQVSVSGSVNVEGRRSMGITVNVRGVSVRINAPTDKMSIVSDIIRKLEAC